MLYLANPSTSKVRDAMTAGLLGCMATPDQGNVIDPSWTWAADNGCFSTKWEVGKWLGWLARQRHRIERCLFAVVPDVVADHDATLARWQEWAPVVRALGYRTAFVLQDGCTVATVPWAECDAVFIGGSTDFKLSATARQIAEEARRRGKHVHMGRVNSRRRCELAARFCDSADGTYLAFGPDVNLPKLLSFMRSANRRAEHTDLWGAS